MNWKRLLPRLLFFASSLEAAAPVIESVSFAGSDARIELRTRAGSLYEEGLIRQDVRALYSTGRFSDIRVSLADGSRGRQITFEVTEARRLFLRSIRTEPEAVPDLGFKADIPPGTPVDAMRAQAIAGEYRRQLSAQGYAGVSITPEIRSLGSSSADVVLHVSRPERVKISGIQLVGDPALDRKLVRRSLDGLEPRRIIPGIPRVWNGWSLRAPYSPEAIDSGIARLRSLYLSRGYFDATVRKDHTTIAAGEAAVTLAVDPGTLYRAGRWQVRGEGIGARGFDSRALCDCLFRLRRESEKQGVLDFNLRLTVDEKDPGKTVDLTAAIERGRAYRIRRIEFAGNRRFSDALIRRNFLLHEGELLDSTLLRRSLERLNRSSLFEPLDESRIEIAADRATGLADIRVRLKERKFASWMLSGPVGPMSFAGPLQFSLAARLPAWGGGALELSSWYASLNLSAYSSRRVRPVLALQKPYVPGQGWISGITIAPQLGWRGMLLSYGSTQIRERFLLPWSSGAVPRSPLTITIDRHQREAVMFCEPPEPRWKWLRRGAALAIEFAGAWRGLIG